MTKYMPGLNGEIPCELCGSIYEVEKEEFCGEEHFYCSLCKNFISRKIDPIIALARGLHWLRKQIINEIKNDAIK